jgi:5-methylcytosine-specific restriction endonuclease McrA
MDKRYKFENACIKNGIYSPDKYICKQYIRGLSCNEIAEKLLNEYNIKVSVKHLSDKIKGLIGLRNYSERKKNAIKRGRMVYHKKPKHEKYKHGSLSSKIRFKVLQRDKFKCTLCGNSPETGATLEIHHINGAKNEIENLQTLCYSCHRGLHYTKRDI